MRLYEIAGDSESEVYNKLRTTYTIFLSYRSTPNKTAEFEKLYNDYLEKVHEDTLNLNYWILTSDRINKLYNEIKQLI